MGSRGMSMSTGDIASALEAQQQHQQLLQRRVSAAVPDASAMWSSHSAVCTLSTPDSVQMHLSANRLL